MVTQARLRMTEDKRIIMPEAVTQLYAAYKP